MTIFRPPMYMADVFAIRHKPTGAFMPSRMFRAGSGRGWTHWDPNDATAGGYGGFDKNPRVFFTRKSANKALGAWLAGPWEKTRVDEGDWVTGYTTFDGPPVPFTPKVPRLSAEMEIVSLTLHEV
jgi:hypothetical protein